MWRVSITVDATDLSYGDAIRSVRIPFSTGGSASLVNDLWRCLGSSVRRDAEARTRQKQITGNTKSIPCFFSQLSLTPLAPTCVCHRKNRATTLSSKSGSRRRGHRGEPKQSLRPRMAEQEMRLTHWPVYFTLGKQPKSDGGGMRTGCGKY